MKVLSLLSASYGSNCYILVDKTIAVIDPGLMAQRVVNETRELHITALLFINTHCHFDHTGGLPELRKKLDGEYLIHELDATAMEKGLDEFQLTSFFGNQPLKLDVSRRLKDGDVIDLGNTKLEVIHTPGHTKGSICLYEEKSMSLFTGDTIFADGVGRTDFPGGSKLELKESIEKLIRLHNTRGVETIYPGHGPTASGDSIEEVYGMFF